MKRPERDQVPSAQDLLLDRSFAGLDLSDPTQLDCIVCGVAVDSQVGLELRSLQHKCLGQYMQTSRQRAQTV